MAHRVVVNTELLRNGADCPVFGVEQVTNVSLRFKIEHPIPPFQEYGSMNRPLRPQTMQRSQPENVRGLLWLRVDAWELWPAAGSCSGPRNEGNLDPSPGQRSGVGDICADGPGVVGSSKKRGFRGSITISAEGPESRISSEL